MRKYTEKKPTGKNKKPNQPKVILGMYESKLNEMAVCALWEPSGNTKADQVNTQLYHLFIMTGEPGGEKREAISRPYTGLSFGYIDGHGFSYNPETEWLDKLDWHPFLVPKWAISLAMDIRGIIRKAEQVGHEVGYASGMECGKSFVAQLARGELTSPNFEDIDGQDSRRLSAKGW